MRLKIVLKAGTDRFTVYDIHNIISVQPTRHRMSKQVSSFVLFVHLYFRLIKSMPFSSNCKYETVLNPKSLFHVPSSIESSKCSVIPAVGFCWSVPIQICRIFSEELLSFSSEIFGGYLSSCYTSLWNAVGMKTQKVRPGLRSSPPTAFETMWG